MLTIPVNFAASHRSVLNRRRPVSWRHAFRRGFNRQPAPLRQPMSLLPGVLTSGKLVPRAALGPRPSGGGRDRETPTRTPGRLLGMRLRVKLSSLLLALALALF